MKFVIAIFVISLVCVSSALTDPLCCDSGVLIMNNHYTSKICDNFKNLSIACTRTTTLSNSWSEYNRYTIQRDFKGEYLDAFGTGYIVRTPYFCVGQLRGAFSEKIHDVALVCNSYRIWYSDMGEQEKPPAPPLRERILPITLEVLNLVSAFTLALTAFVYGFLRDLQDTQGICTFHFTLITAVLHTALFYTMAFNENGLLPNLCITNLYLQMYILLCSFMWCSIMGFNSWIHVKSRDIIDEGVLINRYRYFGYGFPIMMVFLANLYAHGIKLYSEFRMEMKCTSHQNGVWMVSVLFPIILACLANIYFFVDIQRHLWNSPALELRSEKSTLKMMKYRLLMNGKLFFITGLSWTGFFLSIIMYQFNWNPFFLYGSYLIVFIASSQGIAIFLLLVFFRKRVLKAVSRTWLTRYSIFPARWRNATDSETVEDDLTAGQSYTYEKEIDSRIFPVSSNEHNEDKDKA